MSSLMFPLESTATGDLKLDQTLYDVAVSRARLFVSIQLNEREMIPEYGNTLSPFMPDNILAELEAIGLKSDLKRWCEDPRFEYVVDVMNTYNSGNLDFDIRVKLL
ncbi:hypothetical protein [Chroococcidiopsis sp.]|uniref:hypothetical protein n=1 Tax=Chroococcidiopsis sp. TaxID=3088168 RepID=UPI003F39FFB0